MSQENRYCSSCGSQLTTGASFCAKCGAPAPGTPPPSPAAGAPPGGYYRRREYRHEKQEKQEKNEKQEKGRRGSITGPIVGGLILIWLGVTFYLQQTNVISSDRWWAYFLAGIGAILILQGLINFGATRRPFIGSFIGGAFLLLIGLFFIWNVQFAFWPLFLVIIGIAILASSLTMRRRTPAP